MKKIGLVGFGCVGQGLYLLLSGAGYDNAVIKRIIVKNRDKTRIAPSEIIGYDIEELLEDPEIDIIVEAIDDAEWAYEIARKTLVAGKQFVTANKKLVATHLEELTALAKINNSIFRYEAAVCGAIPVVQTIDNYFAYEPIYNLRGIFNGTSNYILSKIFQEKSEYKLALKQAQDLGFAETDPTSDVGGYDAKYKLIILALHAFGVYFKPEEVVNFGIEYLTADDIKFAQNKNLKIKLVPTVYQQDQKIAAFVIPEFVSSTDSLFNVEQEFNGVSVEAGFAGPQFLFGRGAGSFPTATAVLSDIQHVVDGRKYLYTKSKTPLERLDEKNIFLEIYVRYTEDAVKKIIPFESITEGLITPQSHQLVGYVSLKDLKNIAHLLKRERVSVIATGRRKVKAPSTKFGLVHALSEKA